MQFIQKTLVAAAVALSAPAFAGIAPTSSGNGELFLVLFNPTAEVSLTIDLGTGINDFRAAYDFNGVKTMAKKSWIIDTDNAKAVSFLAKAGASTDWRWYVQAGDSVGSQSVFGGRGQLNTLTAGLTETDIQGTRNNNFTAIAPKVDAFLSAANQAGDTAPDDFTTHGYSYGDKDNGAYALMPVFAGVNGGGFANFTNDNAFGTAAKVFYVTRNSSSNLQFVKTDQFNNGYGVSTFAVAAAPGGDYKLTFATAVPEPGTYALLLAGLATVGALARRRRA